MNDIYLIDTSIFMYARGKDHEYKEPCSDIILAIGSGLFEQRLGQAVIDSELYQEILYRYSLIGKWDTAISLLCDIQKMGISTLPVGKEEVDKIIKLAEKYKDDRISPRDIVHAATMNNNNIKKIISTDRDFDRIQEVERIDPVNLELTG
jgi:predicted nucleic acid-binding protein